MCHVSRVRCCMSCVRCRIWCVTCERSLTPTATAKEPPTVNSPIMHTRPFFKDQEVSSPPESGVTTMTQTGTQTHNSRTSQLSATAIIFYTTIINRPGVAGAVVQTALSFIKWLSEPFPPDIQNIIASKPLELESWNFDRMFTPYHVSCVMCHVSRVTCHMAPVTCHLSPVTCFFVVFVFYKKNGKSGEASWWRVCY